MCTLVALHGVVPRTRLLVAANRDEFFDRPAEGPALRATANWHSIAREWIYGDEPATELGRQEATFNVR